SEIRTRGVTAFGHAEWPEDLLGNDLIERLTGNGLHGVLQIYHSFTGIAEAGPRIKIDSYLVLGIGAPSGESSAVAENDARGNLIKSWVMARTVTNVV